MAYRLRLTLDIDWIPDGSSGALLGQNQSNNPGYGASLGPGEAGAAQTLELMVSEIVAGGDTLTQANLNTALTNAANDLQTITATAGAWGGNPQTPTALATAWATGGP